MTTLLDGPSGLAMCEVVNTPFLSTLSFAPLVISFTPLLSIFIYSVMELLTTPWAVWFVRSAKGRASWRRLIRFNRIRQTSK